ncbi:MAG TPA: hypothetical protein VMS32_07200 [Verrucomicrobiae bacterium]|jgi:hypothetical protein|nr:hypothetical protein [Verrucomicrobiae bacterium]
MNAYADRLALDIVAAPLAEIDRRTLSQAWYSALHLARGAHAPAAPGRAPANNSPDGLCLPTPRERDAAPASAGGASRTSGDSSAFAARGVEGERRRPVTPLARKIERALVRPQALARRVMVTFEGRRGRVELLVRSSGEKLHLIAICAPGAHDRVAEALAHARFALARRGIGLQASAQRRAR